ncbi:MAG TPA: hypothetical protein VG963_18755 [Polyangiaceae bacterium]|nr:hypothetical protein [Polyangiaceae bacterium]
MLLVFPMIALLAGCPDRDKGGAPAKLPACKELGQSCEFSPGKLGSCVQIDGCREGNCFVCQSQH